MPHTHHEIFLARQPILDRRQSIVAFELLFRSSESNSAEILDDLQASASVINYAFGDLGMGSALGNGKCFINVSKKLLMSGMVELLPKERVVLELLESIEVDEQVMERGRQLKSQGFSLALDDFASGVQHEPLMEVVDLVKVDLIRVGRQGLPELVRYLKRWRVKLLAEKVETQEEVDQCMELGFDYFQGYYFARPHMIIGKRIDPSKMAALDLLGLILAEAETDEIEQAFKRSPSLSYNLLKLINSVAGGLPRKVSSLNQAIIALGRRQLLRWLQLLLFADQQKEGRSSPLLQLAAIRGRMLELLAQSSAPSDKEYQDRAFMSGILSLLDVLLGLPMSEIVSQINLGADVKEALLDRKGKLGALVSLSEKLEQNDFDATAALIHELNITMDSLMQAQTEAMRWAVNINEPSQA